MIILLHLLALVAFSTLFAGLYTFGFWVTDRGYNASTRFAEALYFLLFLFSFIAALITIFAIAAVPVHYAILKGLI